VAPATEQPASEKNTKTRDEMQALKSIHGTAKFGGSWTHFTEHPESKKTASLPADNGELLLS
jgi:hypothetical protein